MAFDGIVTSAIVAELSEKLTGGKIEKIYQPSYEEIILIIRNNHEKYNLYISATTNNSGIYFIKDKGLNPANPPAFCMLLRKHLQSAYIHEIKQVDSERIVEIHTDAVNELGFNVNHKLIIEIMGKHSNILLVDLKTNKIIDCIKRLSVDVNRYRQTLPGLNYIAPPSHKKIPYFNLDQTAFLKGMEELSQYKPDKALMTIVQGISPVAATELWKRAKKSSPKNQPSNPGELLIPILTKMTEALPLHKGAYLYLDEEGVPKEFHILTLSAYEETCEIQYYNTVSEACIAYFEGRSSSNRLKQKSSDIRRHVASILDKLLLKKQRLSEDLLKAEDSEKYRLYGELLTASLHKILEGRTWAEVENYYDGSTMKIPLDPRYSPAQNAQRYFKKYSKSRTAIVEKNKQLEEAEVDISYIDSILTFIDNAKTLEDIEDIRAELIENGLLKRKLTKEKAKKSKISPYEYETSTGKKIFIGRNNKENDILTFKIASSTDLWLHTKDIPGSHVILFTKGEDATEKDIFQAAALAAAHSKAKHSGNVPVDYVKVKYVKKPNGAKPGYVIFTHNKTIYVDPVKL